MKCDKTKPPPISAFQKRVYEALKRVPKGRVTTYGRLARRVGCGSARAVGQALGRNPFAPVVPCHRVIAGDLTLGGFNGARRGPAIQRKRAVLAAEGVQFGPDGVLLEVWRLFDHGARRKSTRDT